MTIEQVLATLDAIALEITTVEQCAVCRRSFFRNELSESGASGARVCAKCDQESSAPDPISVAMKAA